METDRSSRRASPSPTRGRGSPSPVIGGGTRVGGSDEEGLQTDLTLLRPRAVAYYAVQVVQALDALHTSQIVSSESLALAPLSTVEHSAFLFVCLLVCFVFVF